MLFSNKKLPDISIIIGKENIMRVFETKFLGVVIQPNLKWNSHVSSVANKISKTVGIIFKVKNILSSAHLTILYHSLIEPYLHYCCIVWATHSESTLLETLLKLQKRCCRIICYAPPKAHSRPLFNKLRVFTISVFYIIYLSVNCF